MAQCPAISDPDSIWPHFCPNLPAAYVFAVIFGITTTAHFVQMFLHRKPYSWVITFSAGMQTATYVLRVLSIQNPANENFYSYWFILMMVAPVWTNAYAFMVMGRMVYNFTPEASVFNVKAWRFGLIFVLLDVAAFLVQLGGAAVASTSGNPDLPMLGIHIYMGGIGFQQLCIFLFLALAIRLHQKLRLQRTSPDRSRGILLLSIEYVVVGLITLRIIFRLIEYSDGIKSTIPKHEAYQYVFDSTLMLIALVLFNVFHPGRLMPGSESNLPSRKQRKSWKKEGIAPHGRAIQDYLLPKYRSHAADLTGESPSFGYHATHGDYARVSTPSPTRGESFDHQPDDLALPTRPRSASLQEYQYGDQSHTLNRGDV